MKAITIRQPWAELITAGQKDTENRTWPTRYRGAVLIHAAAAVHPIGARAFPEEARNAPRGAIVAIATLTDCVQFSESPWFKGPYGFVLSNVHRLSHPIPYRGALGLFEIPDTLITDSDQFSEVIDLLTAPERQIATDHQPALVELP